MSALFMTESNYLSFSVLASPVAVTFPVFGSQVRVIVVALYICATALSASS